MNRNILIAILLLSLGAGRAALAQEADAAPALDWDSFKSIAQKNIFDPTRSGRGGIRNRPRPAIVRSFTFRGTIDDIALFTGEGTPAKGYVKVGDLINGFTVRQITLRSVKLTVPNGTILTLDTDDSMRQEENGPWTKSDQFTPAPVAVTETPSDESTAASDSAPAGLSDRLKMLRLKREQEDK
jgi:hypothetical protein